MATQIQIEKYNEYRKKLQELYEYGVSQGLIYPYERDQEFMERLRHIYWGGLRASVLVLCESVTNGFCYDRSYLAAFGFGDDDFKQVYACIDGILLRPDYIDKYQELIEEEKQNFHFGEHCYMERTKKDGTIWVYDPSHGLVYRKDIFDEIQHPRVIKVKFKEDVINSKEYQDIKNEDIEHSKYTLPVWIPKIETCLLVGQNFHMEALCEELELFKREIDYYGLCRVIHNDLKSLGLCF